MTQDSSINTGVELLPVIQPCPLCKSSNVDCDRGDGREFPVTVVWCRDCGCTVDNDAHCGTDEPPFDRWNRRPTTTGGDELASELGEWIRGGSQWGISVPRSLAERILTTLHSSPSADHSAEVARLELMRLDAMVMEDNFLGELAAMRAVLERAKTYLRAKFPVRDEGELTEAGAIIEQIEGALKDTPNAD